MEYRIANEEWQRDGELVRKHLREVSGGTWHLKTAITEMRDQGFPHWRQSEWPGFYFEFREQALGHSGFPRGPRYGNVEFDLQSKLVWDLKVHVDGKSMVPLNDQEAVRDCISERGFLGWMILTGTATYASDSERDWHTELKGGLTAYASNNRKEGKRQRRIKSSFTPQAIVGFGISGIKNLERAVDEGWLVDFQKGLPNSDGSPRRAKYMANLLAIPDWAALRP
jgi:hypothetical protein